MQAVLFNDVVDMFENDFIIGKTYFISNGMLSIHCRVEEAPTNINVSYGLYNFIDLKDFQHHLDANNLTSKCVL